MLPHHCCPHCCPICLSLLQEPSQETHCLTVVGRQMLLVRGFPLLARLENGRLICNCLGAELLQSLPRCLLMIRSSGRSSAEQIRSPQARPMHLKTCRRLACTVLFCVGLPEDNKSLRLATMGKGGIQQYMLDSAKDNCQFSHYSALQAP
eukprot:117946-Amphidinium_carterae.1